MPIHNSDREEIREKKFGRIPHFTKPLQAALWIREGGNEPLTNQTFWGLLSDLCGGSLSQQESETLRILTRPGSGASSHHAPKEGFLTKEEANELLLALDKEFRKPNLSYEETRWGLFVKYYD